MSYPMLIPCILDGFEDVGSLSTSPCVLLHSNRVIGLPFVLVFRMCFVIINAVGEVDVDKKGGIITYCNHILAVNVVKPIESEGIKGVNCTVDR